MMNSVFDSWPENMTRNEVREMDPDDVYDEGETEEAEDEDEDEDEEDEAEVNPTTTCMHKLDEYADMPPLVTLGRNGWQPYDLNTPVRIKTEPVCPPAPNRVLPGRGLGLMRKGNSAPAPRTTNAVIDLTEDDNGPVTRSKAKKAKYSEAPVHTYWQ